MRTTAGRRASARGLTLVEAAVGLSLSLSVAAIALPAFVRSLVSSKFVEPVDGLGRIGAAACAQVNRGEPVPPSAPLTPSEVPRGQRAVDPPGTWDSPTWRALAFRPSENGAPHAFSFLFEDTSSAEASRTQGPSVYPPTPFTPGAPLVPPPPAVLRPSFRSAAHGDLDGDGVTSTFEIHSEPRVGNVGELAVSPELYVEAEVE